MPMYEIKNTKTRQTLVLVAQYPNREDPAWRAKMTLERIEKAGGKGKYTLEEVK